MVVYSISDIEKLSGVKAHTIRIWEKRYGIIPHRRTETNIRYYNDEDLQIILNIALLNKKGYKISKIAALNAEEIKQAVAVFCEVDEMFEDQIDGLTLSMLELNEYNFLMILDQHLKNKGLEKTMDEIVYPFLDKLSIMWIAGSVRGVHEAFVTNIIRAKLFVEIDHLRVKPYRKPKKFLVYLPEGEDHELSILFLTYLIKVRGGNVFYLGSNVPYTEVLEAISVYKPEFIFTLFNDSFSDKTLQPYIDDICKASSPGIVGVSGYQVSTQKINPSDNLILFDSLNEIINFIDLRLTPEIAKQLA
jgi:MerR family transcriptional regulator, light-induced transcriptional regulator